MKKVIKELFFIFILLKFLNGYLNLKLIRKTTISIKNE